MLASALYASLAGFVVGSLFGSVAYQLFPYFLVAYTTHFCRSPRNLFPIPTSKRL